MGTLCPGKNAWPELMGESGEEAAMKIEKEKGGKVEAIVVLLEGTAVIHDYRCNRVWVWVDRHGTVVRVPRLG